MQFYENAIESKNYAEIIEMYTGLELYKNLNASLRFSKRDIFLLSA
jgi:hypothetical protein